MSTSYDISFFSFTINVCYIGLEISCDSFNNPFDLLISSRSSIFIVLSKGESGYSTKSSFDSNFSTYFFSCYSL